MQKTTRQNSMEKTSLVHYEDDRRTGSMGLELEIYTITLLSRSVPQLAANDIRTEETPHPQATTERENARPAAKGKGEIRGQRKGGPSVPNPCRKSLPLERRSHPLPRRGNRTPVLTEPDPCQWVVDSFSPSWHPSLSAIVSSRGIF